MVWKYVAAFVGVFFIVYLYKYQGIGNNFFEKEVKEEKEEEHRNYNHQVPSLPGKPLKSNGFRSTNEQQVMTKILTTSKPLIPSTRNIPASTKNLRKANLHPTPKIDSEKYKELLKQFVVSQKKKVILTYTKVFGDDYWWDAPINFKFHEPDGSPCEVDWCKVVYKQSSIKSADAVLFHAADLPPANDLKKLRESHPKQEWVWMSSESPLHYKNEKVSFKEYNRVFNWTGTYRMDSTIWTPLYLIRPLQSSDKIPDPQTNYAQGKDKMIIAIISNNCNSYRIDFIRKLKKYINIDLYGACKEEVNPELPDCQIGSQECQRIQSQYKFTLSLENAFCTDYVTEKFYWNGLIRGNVPIVLNRGNLTNPRVAPPNSFINILDFKDMESLAKYITKVASNDGLYNNYHAWRKYYKVGTQNRMCTTCKQLWLRELSKTKQHTPNIFYNPDKYWSFEDNCISYENEKFQRFLK